TCAEVDGVAHTEIDIDADPEAARTLSVLSLPTTVVFDAAGRQRYRSTGVPSAADLRAVLRELLA
ncbi:TlpA family protein disulfide reductase, partial [Mycolicibacterium hippocampi]